IRDGHVTGVQTCALPIFWTRERSWRSPGLGERQLLSRVQSAVRVRGWMSELSRKNAELQDLYGRLELLAHRMAEELRLASNVQRSEARRVGKERSTRTEW